jgi:hypothetical protein
LARSAPFAGSIAKSQPPSLGEVLVMAEPECMTVFAVIIRIAAEIFPSEFSGMKTVHIVIGGI